MPGWTDVASTEVVHGGLDRGYAATFVETEYSWTAEGAPR